MKHKPVLLSGVYKDIKKIKKCNNCDKISPYNTNYCYWCGESDTLDVIDFNEELKKRIEENQKVESKNSDSLIGATILFIFGFVFAAVRSNPISNYCNIYCCYILCK